MAFFAVWRPLAHSSTPPRSVSSTSTVPVRRSRPGRTIARRNLWSHVHAVSQLPSPNTCCSPRALVPVFWLVTHHIARNQVGKGVRVSWKIVPAVTDVCRPHAAHSNSAVPIGHALVPPHFGQRKPFGHRSCTRYE